MPANKSSLKVYFMRRFKSKIVYQKGITRQKQKNTVNTPFPNLFFDYAMNLKTKLSLVNKPRNLENTS